MKLTNEQACDIFIRAGWEKRLNPNLRLGQAIWNEIPKEVSKQYVGTKKDFFFEEDSQVVVDMFFKWYVEDE